MTARKTQSTTLAFGYEVAITATLFIPGGRSSRVLRDTSIEALLERRAGGQLILAANVGGGYRLKPDGYGSEYGQHWRRMPGWNVYAYRESLATQWRTTIFSIDVPPHAHEISLRDLGSFNGATGDAYRLVLPSINHHHGRSTGR
jgi:hypothetical protein